MALRIEDYGIIGDLHTAALVGTNGSIDWLCLPRFDSAACFASLLGTPENGSWRIAPVADAEVTRRYLHRDLGPRDRLRHRRRDDPSHGLHASPAERTDGSSGSSIASTAPWTCRWR